MLLIVPAFDFKLFYPYLIGNVKTRVLTLYKIKQEICVYCSSVLR